MIALHVETVLLQCATGVMGMLWVNHRSKDLSAGYAWIVRGVAGMMSLGAAFLGLRYSRNVVVVGTAAVVVAMAAGSNLASWWRARKRRMDEVASATDDVAQGVVEDPKPLSAKLWRLVQVREYVGGIQRSTDRIPIGLDMLTAGVGAIGVIAGGVVAATAGGGAVWLSVLRVIAGSMFLGAIIALIVLAHWYLAQTGLPRDLLIDMVEAVGWTCGPLVVVLMVPPGMASVFTGSIDDGYNGMLGWFWAACAVTTIALVFVIRAVLRERDEAAIMAGIGLTHIILLTSLGTDLVARAILSLG